MKKQTKRILLIVITLLLAAILAGSVLVCYRGREPGGVSSGGESSSEPVSSEVSSEEVSSEEESSQPVSSKPVVSRPVSQAPVSSAPATTSPEEIIRLVVEKMNGLAGTSTAVGAISNPLKVELSCSDTEDVNAVAAKLLEEIKTAMKYEEGKANPNVATGKPNPFSYQYRLVHTGSADGKHQFVLEYRFVSTNTTVEAQGYDTNRLVTDICAYLDGLGKTKFDSQTAGEDLKYQAVIVRASQDYETVLNTVKAQVENASRAYREYDFYYKAKTVSTKGGVEEEAYLFCIYNR